MLVYRIFIKECRQRLRDHKVMMIMTLMPVLIIMLMGMAISGAFSQNDFLVQDLHMDLIVQGEPTDQSQVLQEKLYELVGQERVHRSQDFDEAIDRLRSRTSDGLLVYKRQEGVIEIHENDTFNVGMGLVATGLSNHLRQVNAGIRLESMSTGGGLSHKVSLSKKGQASAMDYYGLAMALLFVFYGTPMAMSSVMQEKNKGTFKRMLLGPLKAHQVVGAKILGNFVVASLQFTFVMVTSRLIFNVNWGPGLRSWILVVTMVMLAMTLGACMGYVFSNESKTMGILHGLIVIFAIFGGSYMPLSGLGFFARLGKFISPIWWNMRGLLDMIYGGTYETYGAAIAFNIVASCLLLGLTTVFVGKRRVSYD